RAPVAPRDRRSRDCNNPEDRDHWLGHCFCEDVDGHTLTSERILLPVNWRVVLPLSHMIVCKFLVASRLVQKNGLAPTYVGTGRDGTPRPTRAAGFGRSPRVAEERKLSGEISAVR